MRTRRILPLAAAVALSAVGCTSGDGRSSSTTQTRSADQSDPDAGTNPESSMTSTDGSNGSTPSTGSSSGGPGTASGMSVALVRFEGCDEVLNYVKSQALEHVGPYGLEGQGRINARDGVDMAVGTFAEGTAAAAGSELQAADSSESASLNPSEDGLTSETGTNVQEAGVDEPDIIKTDGKRIITLTGSQLTVSDITDRTPKVTGTLDVKNVATDMVLSGDKVLVFSAGGGSFGPVQTADAEAGLVPDDRLPDWTSRTVITEISIADAPKVVGSVSIEGNYLSARSVGKRLRVAVSSPPVSLPWVFPQTPAGEDRAEESNRQIIEESTLDDWLPNISINGAEPAQLLNCDSIHRPAEFAGFDTVSIVDLDLDAGLTAPTDAVGVLASGQTVYSSADRFYVASTDYNWGFGGPIPLEGDFVDSTAGDGSIASIAPAFQDATTDIHAFSISDTEPTAYVASGEVPGSLLNQFAMDSYDGNLRVVTTSTKENGDTETFLRVLAEQGNRLAEIGSVGGLGKGEQLYSARLFDQIGFAVTFEQIDPLYVLDLADPTNPRISGELKIPGFSTYLHPIGDGRLLGVGAAATEEGRRTGLKVSLFDVSDVANPTEISNWTLEDAGSNAEYDYHAFQYSDGMLVLPLSNENWNGVDAPPAPSAVVLRIDDKVTEAGRITIKTSDAEPESDCRTIDGDTPTGQGTVNEIWGATHVQVCGPDDKGGYGDYQCEPLQYADVVSGTIPPDSNPNELSELGMTRSDRLELCWPGDRYWNNQIERVINVNDTFYTLTPSTLQANDRSSLDLLGAVPVGG